MHVNSARLKQLIEAKGGMAIAAVESDLGLSTLQKLCAGNYRHRIGPKVKRKILTYFKVPEAEIFDHPVGAGRKRKSA